MEKGILVPLVSLIVPFILISGCFEGDQITYISNEPRAGSIPADAVKVLPQDDQHPPVLHSDLWEQPVPLSGPVNTAGAEDSPFILPDGKTLYFFFTPDVRKTPEQQLLDGFTGIWVSKYIGTGWNEPERVVLQDVHKPALDGAAFVQDNKMWFASAREGYTGVNLFTAEYRDGSWKDWRYAGDRLMKDYRTGEMHITSDWKQMYFHSDRSGGAGQFDIWMTENDNGEWKEPINIEAVNTPENDGWPFISQDGRELWFLRTYMGTPGIFRSLMVNGSWSEPELILSSFAGEPTLDNDGNLYFVHHFYRDSKMIEADIYVCHKK